MNGALNGIKVVDLGRVVAGPIVSMFLGDMGADVIKLEPAPDGDVTRAAAPRFTEGMGSYFATVNRNKRSVIADLRQPGGMKILRALLADADVLVENFRPGILEAMGLDETVLRRDFPRLVVARVSAYGAVGPDAHRPGVDQIIQGISGLMSVTGQPDGGPNRVGIAVSDLFGGLCTTIAVMGALMAREQSGQGQIVKSSLLEATLGLMSVQAGKYFATGEAPKPEGNHHPVMSPYGLFETADGFIQLQIMSNRNFDALARLCNRPDWPADPRYDSPASRSENKEAIRAEVAAIMPTRTTAEWLEGLQAADIPCGPVLNLKEAYQSPQAQALGMTLAGTLGDGTPVELPRYPFTMADSTVAMRRPPPLPGEHTEEVLTALGLADDPEVRAATERSSVTKGKA